MKKFIGGIVLMQNPYISFSSLHVLLRLRRWYGFALLALLVLLSGFYGDEKGKVYCLPCPLGQYNSELGKTKCLGCDSGQYSKEPANSNNRCLDCPAGFNAEHTNSITCSLCASGQWMDEQGKSFCSLCASGQYRENSNSDNSSVIQTEALQCLICPIGYASGEGERRCDECAAGKSILGCFFLSTLFKFSP